MTTCKIELDFYLKIEDGKTKKQENVAVAETLGQSLLQFFQDIKTLQI
jgi:hypothetical protein